MVKKLIRPIIKTLILLLIFSGVYYFYNRTSYEQRIVQKKNASEKYSNLVENKNAYVALTKLDPKDPGFDIQKSNLVGIIKETNQKGSTLSNGDESAKIYERQNAILDKVFATKSYEEGLAILKSQEAIDLLVAQTKLLEEMATQMK